jgi:aminoglycoside phosphotransferase (APT) family kinase protein
VATAETQRALAGWLERERPSELLRELSRLDGGNSNETYLLLTSAGERRILRKPPAATIDATAHSMSREHRVLSALADTDVPAPRPLALCEDESVLGAPFILMELIEGIAPSDRLPEAYANDVAGAGAAIVDALATLHGAPWQEIGLADFGRPEGFLDRQVGRWQSQYQRYEVRELPDFYALMEWLTANRPPDAPPGILHGDFHADNCLLALTAPRVTAILDWEMATIGDPMLDLGLMLAFWGTDRPEEPAMPRVQRFSRAAGAPARRELAERYAERSGRSVERLDYYLALAFWKLAAIVEGAYAHFLAGKTSDDYSHQLGEDVPRLLREAVGFTEGRI